METEAAGAGVSADRRTDAEAIRDLVAHASGKVVVVLGPRVSGKSAFVHARLKPLLRQTWPVKVIDCAISSPAAALEHLCEPGVIILDSFDRTLKTPDAQVKSTLEGLFTSGRQATLVLVASSHCLGDFFELRKLEPTILDHLFELTQLRLSSELVRLGASADPPVEYSPAVLDSLEEELSKFEVPSVSFLLAEVVHRQYRAGSYSRERGLRGLLASHLDSVLGQLDTSPDFGEGASSVAKAVLKEVVSLGPQRTPPSLTGMAEQLDVAAGVPEACLHWLVGPGGLIRYCDADGWQFDPPQLRDVVKGWVEEDRDACAKAERLLADGIEGRQKLGTLLPKDRFMDVNAQQRLLKVTSDQAAFLTQCALRFYGDHNPGPVNYWFRRIGDCALEVQTLTEALVDPVSAARKRAAAILAGCDEPRVHGHLCRVVLEDEDRSVRRQAADSLALFSHKEPIYKVLEAAAREGADASRIRAIQALRIFPDERCAKFLESVISKPSARAVREAAIDALADTNCEAGAAALVRIALHDADAEDRESAGVALSGLTKPPLVEFALTEAENDYESGLPKALKGGWWRSLGHYPMALAVVWTSFWIHGLALVFYRRYLLGAAFLLVEVVTVLGMFEVLPWPALLVVPLWFLNAFGSILIAAWVSRKREAPPGSFARVLSNVLLGGVMLSSGLFLHGIGHWITGRRRKALRFFGIELVAILAMVSTYALQHLFAGGSVETGLDKFSQGLLFLYRYGALLLSWLAAATSLVEQQRWGRRGPWRSAEHFCVFESILASPVSSDVLFAALRGGAQPQVRRARKFLSYFGHAVPGTDLMRVLRANGSQTPKEILKCLARNKDRKGYERVVTELGEMFDDGGPQERARAVRLLARYPTEGSIQCLSDRKESLFGLDRFRFWGAALVRPFRGWPLLVRVAALGCTLLAILLIMDGLRTLENPGWPQIKELKTLSGSFGGQEVHDLAVTADFLAARYPHKSAAELATLYASSTYAHKEGLAQSLGRIAGSYDAGAEKQFKDRPRPPYWWQDPFEAWENRQWKARRAQAVQARTTAVQALVASLSRPEMRQVSVQALMAASTQGGSPELVAALDSFLAQPLPAGPEQTAEGAAFDNLSMTAAIAEMLRVSLKSVPEAGDVIARRAAVFGKALQDSPDAAAKNQIMNAFAETRDPRAIAELRNFARSPGRDPQARRADVLRVQADARKRAEELLMELDTPEAVSRRDATALDLEARALQNERKLQAAKAKAQEAVAKDPTYVEALGTLGSVLFDLDQKPEALKQFKAATELNPDYSWAFYMQAFILRDLKRLPEAQTALKESLRLDPSFPWAYRLLREIYAAQGRARAGVAELKRLQKLQPELPEIYEQLAFLYHEQIAPTDPSAYEQAYQANRALLNLQKKSNLAASDATEANLLECSLTTGRYSEVIERAPALAARISSPDWQMAMHAFTLAAQVLTRDNRAALASLGRMQSLYTANYQGKSGMLPDWNYGGTLNYLDKRVPKSPQQSALVELIKAVNDIPKPVSPSVFQAMRASLE